MNSPLCRTLPGNRNIVEGKHPHGLSRPHDLSLFVSLAGDQDHIVLPRLADGGFAMADVVRAHYYVTDRAFVGHVYPILGEVFGDIRPAATMIVCELAEPEMKIEIEVTALRRDR